MTIQLIKVPGFVDTTAEPPTATTRYKTIGEKNEQQVQAYVIANTPRTVNTIYGILWRMDVKLTQTAYNHFDIEIPYGKRPNESGQWSWDFDTTGGTVHISNAKQEVARYPAGKAPNQFGAIGVDGDNVAGTDIVIPAMKINVQFRHPKAEMTIARAKYLAGITGFVNSATFLTFEPGEVLFLGARGSEGSDSESSVGYQFAMSKNVTGLNIGGIAGIVKKGWDVAWIRFEDSVESEGGTDHSIRKPRHVYVDRVYDTVDFKTALGFG